MASNLGGLHSIQLSYRSKTCYVTKGEVSHGGMFLWVGDVIVNEGEKRTCRPRQAQLRTLYRERRSPQRLGYFLAPRTIMFCEICNARRGWPRGNNCFYVGRSNKRDSPLGNPYRVGKDGDRKAVVEKYRRWLWEEIKKERRSAAYRELLTIAESCRHSTELEPVRLPCWCTPLPCHAEVIRSAIGWLLETKQI